MGYYGVVDALITLYLYLVDFGLSDGFGLNS